MGSTATETDPANQAASVLVDMTEAEAEAMFATDNYWQRLGISSVEQVRRCLGAGVLSDYDAYRRLNGLDMDILLPLDQDTIVSLISELFADAVPTPAKSSKSAEADALAELTRRRKNLSLWKTQERRGMRMAPCDLSKLSAVQILALYDAGVRHYYDARRWSTILNIRQPVEVRRYILAGVSNSEDALDYRRAGITSAEQVAVCTQAGITNGWDAYERLRGLDLSILLPV